MIKAIQKIALLVLLVLSIPTAMPAFSHTLEEERVYKLKAAFLLNFAKFTTWPESGSQREAFSICIFGKDPFENAFAGLQGKKIANRPIKILRTEDLELASQCNLVFISKSEEENLQHLLLQFTGKPILLVSDIDSFAEDGGIIELAVIERRLGFIINNTRAKEVNLEINSSLLDLARKVL